MMHELVNLLAMVAIFAFILTWTWIERKYPKKEDE